MYCDAAFHLPRGLQVAKVTLSRVHPRRRIMWRAKDEKGKGRMFTPSFGPPDRASDPPRSVQ
jgi:hypothetical protein